MQFGKRGIFVCEADTAVVWYCEPVFFRENIFQGFGIESDMVQVPVVCVGLLLPKAIAFTTH